MSEKRVQLRAARDPFHLPIGTSASSAESLLPLAPGPLKPECHANQSRYICTRRDDRPRNLSTNDLMAECTASSGFRRRSPE